MRCPVGVWGMVLRGPQETMGPEESCLLGRDLFPGRRKWRLSVRTLWGQGTPAKTGQSRAASPISVPGLLYFILCSC